MLYLRLVFKLLGKQNHQAREKEELRNGLGRTWQTLSNILRYVTRIVIDNRISQRFLLIYRPSSTYFVYHTLSTLSTTNVHVKWQPANRKLIFENQRVEFLRFLDFDSYLEVKSDHSAWKFGIRIDKLHPLAKFMCVAINGFMYEDLDLNQNCIFLSNSL